ncbi:MAG: acetyl-CoA acetyltransferase [Candidatus Helarchaeota archaeon]
MGKKGIRDRVAIIGGGATKFGERWDMGVEDLLIEAGYEAFNDAGFKDHDEIENTIEAIWLGNQYWFTGLAGVTAADSLKLYGKPITRVENFCASGMDAFRNACFAVASGVNDVVLACGVEKLMDEGSSGLPGFKQMGHPLLPLPSAPAMFCFAATRSFHEHGWTKEDLARVAVKNHKNGVKHPKAHFRRAITIEDAMNAPMIADPLGRYDCCAMSDGSAALVVTTPELAPSFNSDYIIVKANAVAVETATPWYDPKFDFIKFPATRRAAELAYHEAGVTNPAQEISLAEVHDCFTITELLNCQDLGFCEIGEAPTKLKEGFFNVDGQVAVNPSGGLKCFGHPIGATGCRMIWECYKQLQGKALGEQVKDPNLALAHNLGGAYSVCSVTILGHPD